MTEKNYSKRELDHYFNDIKSILEKQNTTLERIEMQTTKTNGRVSSLEDWRKAMVWGFGVVLTLSILVINKLWIK